MSTSSDSKSSKEAEAKQDHPPTAPTTSEASLDEEGSSEEEIEKEARREEQELVFSDAVSKTLLDVDTTSESAASPATSVSLSPTATSRTNSKSIDWSIEICKQKPASDEETDCLALDLTKPYKRSTTAPKENATHPKELVRCGLENLGYTCYINSVLQMLYDWRKFRIYMLNHSDLGQFHGILFDLFDEMITEASVKTAAVVAPKEFIYHFRKARPEFIAGQQHDAQQFLTALLDLLHGEVNQASKLSAEKLAAEPRHTLAKQAWYFHVAHVDNSFFSQCLLGQVQLTLTCLECGQQTNSWSCIWQLEVQLPQGTLPDEPHDSDKEPPKMLKLSDCIAEHFEKKTLQGAGAPFCGHCASPKPATKQLSLCQAPPFLLVYLKRFSGGRMENKQPVDIDQQLHIGGRRYSLMSVVLHDGTEPGHYGTLCAVQASGAIQWLALEDDQIADANEGKNAELVALLMKKFAYLALYTAEDHK